MKDTNVNLRVGDISSMLADISKLDKTQPQYPNYLQKLADVTSRGFLKEILEPYYSVSSIKALRYDDEGTWGEHFLRLTDEMGLADFSRQFEQALLNAERESGKNRSIENVRTTLNFFSPADRQVYGRARLRITFVRGMENATAPSYVVEEHLEFDYELLLDGSDKLIECPQMPDIEERSIASPVYLVNSQNVKNTFGYTVKENPLGIYLCARRYGWSEVAFHGQQVLLKANIRVC